MNVYDTANRLAQEIKQSEEYIRYNLILRIKYLNEKIKISIIKENAAKEPTLKKGLGEGRLLKK